MLYPRDPSLDPQLVWKGKDEQDAEDLEVPAVPDLHPGEDPPAGAHRGAAQAGEGRRERAGAARPVRRLQRPRFDEQVDFYHHEQNWTNRMILGDSLLVMTSSPRRRASRARSR